MSSHAADHHHHETPFDQWPADKYFGRASLGKIGMWIFLLSDALTFAGFLLAYGVLRGGSDQWLPDGLPELGINFTAILTFLLICSSVTMVMAYAATVDGDRKTATKWLLVTALGGALFLCGQMHEYFGALSWLYLPEAINHQLHVYGNHGLIAEGVIFGESHYATTFFLITAFHGCHVFTGTCYILIMAYRTHRGHYDGGNFNHVEMCGLFWHFVDLIWILVFTFVYLIPY